jgi:hypothetical protein
MSTATKQQKIIQEASVVVRCIPGSLLVVHAFAEKAKQEIRDKQQKKERKAKAQREPQVECDAARYREGSKYDAVPVTALKKAIVRAATAFDDLAMTALRQALFVQPGHDPASMLVRIETEKGQPVPPVMREDAVTIGINTRGLAYRPEYRDWYLRFTVQFNSRLVSAEQLRALIEQAGWGVGICEGRPERSSALGWGRFEIVSFDLVGEVAAAA